MQEKRGEAGILIGSVAGSRRATRRKRLGFRLGKTELVLAGGGPGEFSVGLQVDRTGELNDFSPHICYYSRSYLPPLSPLSASTVVSHE